jgi:hypothetical protein
MLTGGRSRSLAHPLLVTQCNFQIVELRVLKFLAHVFKVMFDPVSQMLRFGSAIRRGIGRHCGARV